MKINSASIKWWVSLCLFNVITVSGFASSATEQQLAEKLQQISQQAEQLQKEMNLLKAELRALKQSKKVTQQPAPSPSEEAFQPVDPKLVACVAEPSSENPSRTYPVPFIPSILPVTVITSPYMGLRTAFDASDLVVNVPTMNEDLRLLREREVLKKKLGGVLPYEGGRPLVVLSGKIEPFIYSRGTYPDEFGIKLKQSDIDLASMELDFLIQASDWALGYVSINYDSSFLDTSLANSAVGSRIANSRVFLRRGFVTLGNLQKLPFYLTAGQVYLNFGRYGSALVTPSLPQLLGQTTQRTIQVGYAKQDGFSFSTYAFKGDAHVSEINRFQINEGGINARYAKEYGRECSVSIGAGLISNIANSNAIQVTNLGYPRQGFASLSEFIVLPNELLVHRAPGMNIHSEFGRGPWTWITEYVGTIRPFAIENFFYNGKGAQPKAVHTELNRKFSVLNKPANASVAFGRSWEALAIGLPLYKYSFVFNVSPVKNTVLSIEFSHFKNYLAGTTAYIKGADVPLIFPFAPYITPGGSYNVIIAQLGLYF